MLTVSKALLISNAMYSDSSRRGNHLVEPLSDGVVKRV